ncbi:hypothetical protein [Streptomyces sp. NRRL S-495]|nr:hypothetical protein [Streptomyces sp. NRRL S-495]
MSCCSTEGTCSTGAEAVDVVVDGEVDADTAVAEADRVPAQRA